MTISSDSDSFLTMTRSEYLSTLPLWRRCLAMLNWRPVFEIEQETERLRIRARASEKRTKLIESDIVRLKSETEQIESDIVRLEIENKRLAALESRLDALLLSADSSSPTPPPTGSN